MLAAHSTGGLILPLWLDRRRAAGRVAPVAGLVLNSPWFDLQGKPSLRGPVTQALRVLSKAQPMRLIKGMPGVYGRTLHVSATGEWNFDVALKPLDGFPVTMGWLNAIRRGHARLHRGLDVGVPSLVLRSTRSDFSSQYTDPERPRRHRARRHPDRSLGGLPRRRDDRGADQEDARHDVFLSVAESRERAYTAVDAWLNVAPPLPRLSPSEGRARLIVADAPTGASQTPPASARSR